MTITENHRSTTMTIDRSNCTAERHGTYSGYVWWKCRCPDAREAWRINRKRAREGRAVPAFIDNTGTARRLQALVALGYDWEYLGRRLNRSSSVVTRLANRAFKRIRRETAAQVKGLFEELSATPAPAGFGAKKARDTAARNGFLPPLAWGDDIDDPAAVPDVGGDGGDVVDEVAVARVADGLLPFRQLNDAEKVALFQRHFRGWGYNAVMQRLHVSAKTVRHWRDRAAAATVGEQVAA